MNFIAICLHCLDMRDFNSYMRNTPFLDALRKNSIFIPFGRAQAHHHADSLNAEMTGIWTARYSESSLTEQGFKVPNYWETVNTKKYPKTVIEYLQENGYEIFTNIKHDWDYPSQANVGSIAVRGGMTEKWLSQEPDRLQQFSSHGAISNEELLSKVLECKTNFYAHFFIRSTHRPWLQNEKLFQLFEKKEKKGWPWDAYCSRRAALDKPDEFAEIRREGLRIADLSVETIFKATEHIKDTVFIVYSNHGEIFDFFRHILPYPKIQNSEKIDWQNMLGVVSHGNYPYEILYSNMQMWKIPGMSPKLITGLGRSIDFAPTILKLANVKCNMDGEDMMPYFLQGYFPLRPRYAENVLGRGCVSLVRNDGFKFISTGLKDDVNKIELPDGEIPWKLIQNTEFDGPIQHRLAVFDLNSDPYEYVNIYNSQKGIEVAQWAIETHAELKSC